MNSETLSDPLLLVLSIMKNHLCDRHSRLKVL